MPYKFGDTVGFPETERDAQPLDSGRLAGLFCQLHRRELTGVVLVETDDSYRVFSFRDGTVVFAEESTPGEPVAEQLVQRGLLTREQYADVVSRMTDTLVDNEDVMFCEQAVALGYLSADDVDAEMSSRVRTKVIQAMGLARCRIDIDDSPDAPVPPTSYPQDIGALVYIGVRTFYDEALLESLVPEPARHYMRLLAPLPVIIKFFGLDDDEQKFLRSLDPEAKVSRLLKSPIVDLGHATQMLALLRIAGLAEFASTPYVTTPEPSGVRSTRTVRGRPNTPGYATPDPRREGSSPSTTGFVAAREVTGPANATRRARPAREEIVETRSPVCAPDRSAPREERPFGASPTARSATSSSASNIAAQPRVQPAAARAARVPNAANAPSVASKAPAQEPVAAVTPADARQAISEDTTAQALAEAKARAAKRAAGGGIAAGARIGRQLERLRAPSIAIASPVAENPDYAKAHLKEILARRRQVSQGTASSGAPQKRDPVAELKQAQDLLREKQFARAEEILRGLVELDSANAVLQIYHAWAKLRSTAEPSSKDSDALRDLARKLVQDDNHGAFACFVIGHLAFVAKKDDVAEKFFRKAFSRDKTMKDAERHILILERRQQVLANAEKNQGNKIFGITIGGPKKD